MTRHGLELFDHAEGERAKEAGMARVERNASSDWLMLAVDAVRRVCERMDRFTADHVWRELGDIERPREPKAMGPVMKRAQRLKYCEPTNEIRQSTWAANHRRPVRVWRSKLHC